MECDKVVFRIPIVLGLDKSMENAMRVDGRRGGRRELVSWRNGTKALEGEMNPERKRKHEPGIDRLPEYPENVLFRFPSPLMRFLPRPPRPITVVV